MIANSFDTQGKRLLVLGGTSGKDIVSQAQRMGVYTIVADLEEMNASKRIADEGVVISTTDTEALVALIKEKHIDGVFSGPSEFNIQQVLKVSKAAGLPCYITREQWDACQNKAAFKALCRKFNVPVVPEYEVSADMLPEDLAKVKYPVVVKPTDACSSKGLSICANEEELKRAIPYAIAASESKHFIVEKCITSDCGFGCRYIANDGEIYLAAVSDAYTVDEFDGKAHISAAAVFPSKKIDTFINNINPNLIKMFKSIGLANGTFFMQALVDQDDGEIYFHEMGLRLSGGLIYPMVEAACGYNDVQMMIRYALGGPMATSEDISKIDPYMHGHFIGSLTFPLKAGKISHISGLEEVKKCENVMGVAQYYYDGDEVKDTYIGTLSQHLCRVKIMTESIEEYKNLILWIESIVSVIDVDGNDMIYRRFDINRLK